MLRAVLNAAGEWDALDQLGDEPASDEGIYLYKMVPGTLSSFHLCRSPRKLSGWYQEADYVVFGEKIPDSILRNHRQWVNWCDENKNRLTAGYAKG